MFPLDTDSIVEYRQHEIRAEAARARLAAQLPRTRNGLLHTLAQASYALATRLDHQPEQYVRPREVGPEDWVWRSGSA